MSLITRSRIYASHFLQSRRHGRTPAERRAIFRTLNDLYAAMRRDNAGVVDVPIMGHPMRGFRAGTLHYLFREMFLAEQYKFPAQVPDPVIVDCGANIGFSVLYFKLRYPQARIIAFEANPKAFEVLSHNVATNQLSGVELRPVALSDGEGEIPFFVGEDPGTLLGSVREDRDKGQRLMVKSERLSRTLATLERVDLVKIDIEGAEWAVLSDLITTGTLAKPQRYIIEYHHQIAGETPKLSAFLAPFEQAGFRYHVSARWKDPAGMQDVLLHLVRG